MVKIMSTETKEITNSEDVIDVRDITERVETLESEITEEIEGDDQFDDNGKIVVDEVTCGTCGFTWNDARVSSVTPAPSGRCPVEDEHEERAELKMLTELLEELRGNGGDHDWRGDWYPLLLVRDSYFKEFAQEEAESLDLVKPDARWPYTCIDWEEAAEELKQDYNTVEFEGVTYWYR